VPPEAADFTPGPGSIGVLVAGSPSDVRAAAGLASSDCPLVALVDPRDAATRAECAAIGADLIVPASTPFAGFADLLRAVGRGERPPSPLDPAVEAFGANLTRREREILSDLMAGRRAAAIARHSYVSLNTVRTQIRSLLRKLGVHSQLEAVALARRSGWRGDR
jgi:DNA-binding NarL/FixJ family response regulator